MVETDTDHQVEEGSGEGNNATVDDATITVSLGAFSLTVTLPGNGDGIVASSPDGITCGSDCTEVLGYGFVVDLTATPAPGSTFQGFGGDPDCSDGLLTVTGSTTCSARFETMPFADGFESGSTTAWSITRP